MLTLMEINLCFKLHKGRKKLIEIVLEVLKSLTLLRELHLQLGLQHPSIKYFGDASVIVTLIELS